MRTAATVATITCGLTAAALLIMVGGARLGGDSASVVAASQEELAAGEGAASPAAAARPEPDGSDVPARPVAPQMFAMPAGEIGPLERVEPRRPLGELGNAVDPADLPPQPTLLYRPVAVAAGLVEADGHTVRLAGIETTGLQETCGEGAGEWPCGTVARTAFRNWLRGRAIECTVPSVASDETIVSACKLAGDDPAEWLAAQGWVRAAPDGPYAQAADAAERQGLGIYGPAPAAFR